MLQCFATGNAQPITITLLDMPKVNDTLRYSFSNSTINTSKTGTDTTWDFSNITITSQEIEHFYAPSATPYALSFGGTASSYGVPEKNFNPGLGGGVGVTIENPFSFYKEVAGAYIMVGRGATINKLPLGIRYNPQDTMYHLPMTYGSATTTSTFAGSASLLTLGSLNIRGTRTTEVDGWGTIRTPYGTFPCIRVKSTVAEVDSVSITGTIDLPVPNNRTEYRWFTQGERFPLLEVIVPQATGNTQVRFRDHYRAEAYINAAKFTSNFTQCFTSDTVNFINLSVGKPTAYNWTITPAGGTFVGGTSATSANPRMLFSPGTYTVKLSVSWEGGQDDTTAAGYLTVQSKTGIDDVSVMQPRVTISPNPAGGSVVIESTSAITHVEVFDMAGKNTQAATKADGNKKLVMDVSALRAGIYYLRVDGEDGSATRKLVVNR
jgi:PKD repeat protein